MSLPLTKAPDSICILRLSALGDVTHVLPTIRSIQKQWPTTKITWIIGKLEIQLVDSIPDIEFIVFDKSAGMTALRQLRKQLKGRRFDVLLLMQLSLRASLASWIVKADIRLGFDRQRSRNLHSLFINHRITPESTRQHVLDSFLEFAHALGITEDVIEWNIPCKRDPDRIRENFKHHKFIAINPCSSANTHAWRSWPVKSYARLIDFIIEHYDIPVVLTGGPAQYEMDYGEAIYQQTTHKPVNMIGRTSLKQLHAMLNAAEVVIAPDTGPLHIANACGTPTIGLFACTNPQRAGPYSFMDNVVSAYPEAIKMDTGKSVEQVRWGKRVKRDNVMDMVRIEDVIEKFKQVYKA
jgi:heptosyltransferase I